MRHFPTWGVVGSHVYRGNNLAKQYMPLFPLTLLNEGAGQTVPGQ